MTDSVGIAESPETCDGAPVPTTGAKVAVALEKGALEPRLTVGKTESTET